MSSEFTNVAYHTVPEADGVLRHFASLSAVGNPTDKIGFMQISMFYYDPKDLRTLAANALAAATAWEENLAREAAKVTFEASKAQALLDEAEVASQG